MRKTRTLVASAVAALALTIPTAVSRADAAPYCGIRWGSTARQVGEADVPAPRLVNVRAGRHACFDRLVIDLTAGQQFRSVAYVDQVRLPENGPAVPLRGGARLAIFTSATAFAYHPKRPAELVDVTGWRTFRQVAWGTTFEYGTVIGLGVRARLPFRVFVLDGPGNGSRLVVDVAHRW